MAVFIELVTDAFQDNIANQSLERAAKAQSWRAGNRVARRPTRGLEIKEDTYAAIKVVLSNGQELPLIDSSSLQSEDGTGYNVNGYTNFILQNVQEVRMEKHQLIETFGANYIYFFGESPRFLDVQAILINSHDFNWEAEWWANYEENFRGTRLVEKGGRVYLFYDDNIVEGYMLMCQASKDREMPHQIPMAFKLFVTNYRNISFVGGTEFPVHDGTLVIDVEQDARDVTVPSGVAPGQVSQLRSRIADNTDEYAGLPQNSATGVVPGNTLTLPPAAQTQLETDDLHQESIRQLGARGADVDDPTTLSDLGAMPNFESDARSPATFRPKEKEPFGFDTGGESVQQDAVNPLTAFTQDPLGAIFGGSKSSLNQSREGSFSNGFGDAKYGFRSEFATRPGFGQTGYGDLGGPGFGGATGGVGDPGFKDPAQFSFVGVVQNKAAFTKAIRPKATQNVFGAGKGLGASSSGLTGGANVRVGGKVSAFSLISVPGTLRAGS